MNTTNASNVPNVKVQETETETKTTAVNENVQVNQDFLTPEQREGHAAWKARKLKNRSKYI